MTLPVLVIGGTSDARHICQQLDAQGIGYTLFVATPAGTQMAQGIAGEIHCGRLDEAQMTAWLRANQTRWVIDASHPYAEVVSRNILSACQRLGITLTRYQRPEELEEVTHPLLHRVDSIARACDVVRPLGQRVLLTTGSKDLPLWRAGLPDKTLLARVLPVSAVIAECEQLGFGPAEIFAQCGPFSAAFNAAFYQQCRAEVVITKSSGAAGGYQDKVLPCLEAGIPCVVITRPACSVHGDERIDSLQHFAARLARWQQTEESA